MESQSKDRECVLRLLQDLRVKARDTENYMERIKLEKIIKKFERGLKEEYGS